jgi:hypothetical protein
MFKEKFEKFMDYAKEKGSKAIDYCKEKAPKVEEFCEEHAYTIMMAGFSLMMAIGSAAFQSVAESNAKVNAKNVEYLQKKIDKLEEGTDE